MSADYLVPTLRGKACPNFWKGNIYEENLFTLFQIWRKPVPRLQSSKILHLKYNKKDIWKVWPATWSLKTFTQEHDVYTLQMILGAYTKVGGLYSSQSWDEKLIKINKEVPVFMVFGFFVTHSTSTFLCHQIIQYQYKPDCNCHANHMDMWICKGLVLICHVISPDQHLRTICCCGQLWVWHTVCGQTCDGLYHFAFTWSILGYLRNRPHLS